MKSTNNSLRRGFVLLSLVLGALNAGLAPVAAQVAAQVAPSQTTTQDATTFVWPRFIAPASEAEKVLARADVKTLSLDSALLKRKMNFNLILPTGYETSNLRYPTIYLLHGSGGDHANWNAKTGIAAYVAHLPVILVMPAAGGDSRYINSPAYGPVADYLLQELMPHIDATYRTIAKRDGRALLGSSMGGYGAWRLALDAPELFASTASMSGSFKWGENDFDDPQYHARAVKIYGNNGEAAREAYRADRIWAHLEKFIGADGKWTGPALYFNVGQQDFLYDANQVIRKRLQERGVPFEYGEYKGAHTWEYWDEHARDALPFSLAHLALPEPIVQAPC